MNKEQAKQIVELMNTDYWNSGGDIYLLIFRRNDGKMVALSDEVICEYENEESLEAGKTGRAIAIG